MTGLTIMRIVLSIGSSVKRGIAYMECISYISHIIFIAVLIIATIKDIASLYVPLFLSIIGYSTRIIELVIVTPHNIPFYTGITMISFIILLLVAYFGNLGGADCLLGSLCVFYLGIQGLWAIIISFVLAIPYAAWMKIKNNEHEYPFVPYIVVGVILSHIII